MPPLAHYKLNDDAANTDVADSSGNGLVGTASTNTENLSVAAKLNDGFNFAGTHYVVLPDGVPGGLGGAAGATITAWVKRNGLGTRQMMFKLNIAGTSGTKLSLEFQADNTIRAGARSAYPADALQSVTTDDAYTDTASWHLIAAVIDVANDTIKIYYDGALVKTGNVSFSQSTFSADAGTGHAIGAGNDPATYKLNGVMDETRLYAAALTGGQIKRLWNEDYGTEDSLAELYAENNGVMRPVLRS